MRRTLRRWLLATAIALGGLAGVPVAVPNVSRQAEAAWYYYVRQYPFIYVYWWSGVSWVLVDIQYDSLNSY